MRAAFSIYDAKRKNGDKFVMDWGLLGSSLLISGIVGVVGGLYAGQLNEILKSILSIDLQLQGGNFTAIAFGFIGIDIIQDIVERLPFQKK